MTLSYPNDIETAQAEIAAEPGHSNHDGILPTAEAVPIPSSTPQPPASTPTAEATAVPSPTSSAPTRTPQSTTTTTPTRSSQTPWSGVGGGTTGYAKGPARCLASGVIFLILFIVFLRNVKIHHDDDDHTTPYTPPRPSLPVVIAPTAAPTEWSPECNFRETIRGDPESMASLEGDVVGGFTDFHQPALTFEWFTNPTEANCKLSCQEIPVNYKAYIYYGHSETCLCVNNPNVCFPHSGGAEGVVCSKEPLAMDCDSIMRSSSSDASLVAETAATTTTSAPIPVNP